MAFVIQLTSFRIAKFKQIETFSIKTFLMSRGLFTASMGLAIFENDKETQRDRERISLRKFNRDSPDLKRLVG
jgi:hypothetical protein